MKKIIYILVLFPFFLQGQEYPRIDTLNFGENVWLVKNFSQPENGSEEIIYKYYFNKSGKHVSTLYGYNSERQSKTKYEYNKQGQLSIIERLEYSSPKNDSLQQAFNLELMQELRKKDSTGQEIDWDRLNEKYEPLYEKVIPESIDWKNKAKTRSKIIIKRDLMGRDSIMEIYSDISDNKLALDEIVEYYYNEQNELKKKKFIDIPHSNVFTFQAFKSNSTEFEDSIKTLDGTNEEIKYEYGKLQVQLDYFVNGVPTGHKIETWNKSKTEKSIVEFNMQNDTLSYYNEHFNKKGQLLKSERLIQKGYNAFGYSIDFGLANIKIYKYNEDEILYKIEMFENSKLISTQRFEIIKQ